MANLLNRIPSFGENVLQFLNIRCNIDNIGDFPMTYISCKIPIFAIIPRYPMSPKHTRPHRFVNRGRLEKIGKTGIIHKTNPSAPLAHLPIPPKKATISCGIEISIHNKLWYCSPPEPLPSLQTLSPFIELTKKGLPSHKKSLRIRNTLAEYAVGISARTSIKCPCSASGTPMFSGDPCLRTNIKGPGTRRPWTAAYAAVTPRPPPFG
jgi:hypothetical protein